MDQLPFSFVDIAIVLVILISAVLAFVRGFVREVLTIAAWVGAIAVTVYLFDYVSPYVLQYIEVKFVAHLATGLGIFIVALIIFTIISHAMSRNVRDSALGAIDRSMGLLFGVLRGIVIICAIYLGVMWGIPKPEDRPLWIQNARSAPLIEKCAEYLASLLPATIIQSGEKAAGNLTDDAGRLIDAGQAVDALSEGATEGTENTTESGAESDGADEGRSGYNDAERNEMDRVIQSTE